MHYQAWGGTYIYWRGTTALIADIRAFYFGGQDSRIEYLSISNLSIKSSVSKTGGQAIYFNKTAWCVAHNLHIHGHFVGLEFYDVIGGHANTLIIQSCTATTGHGILVDGPVADRSNGIYLVEINIDNEVGYLPSSGIWLKHVDGFWISRCCIGHCVFGIRLDTPVASKYVVFGWVEDCIVEANTQGVIIAPLTGTSIRGISVLGTWIASNTERGLYTYAAGGTLDGLRVIGAKIYDNGTWGIFIDVGENICIDACDVAGNSATTPGSLSAIYVVAGISEFAIRNCRIGQMAGVGNNQSYGIQIATGASDNYIIALNDLRLNVTGAILDGGTGTDKIIRDNIGWVTENSGTDSIASGQTTKVVTHGLAATPTLINIAFREQGTADYGRWWLSAIGATTFTLNVSVDPGVSNLDFGWEAKVR